jgi:hypothetical protein
VTAALVVVAPFHVYLTRLANPLGTYPAIFSCGGAYIVTRRLPAIARVYDYAPRCLASYSIVTDSPKTMLSESVSSMNGLLAETGVENHSGLERGVTDRGCSRARSRAFLALFRPSEN